MDQPGNVARQSFLDAFRREYQQHVQWFLVTRVAVTVVCLLILLVYEEGSPRSFPVAYATLIAFLAAATLHLVLLPRVRDLERFVLVAICLDVCFETVLCYLTGGIYNLGFALLYFISIFSAVLLVSDRAGFTIASVASALLALIAIAYWAAANLDFRPPLVPVSLYATLELRWGRVTANLIVVALALHSVAFLASRLPYRLSRVRLLYEDIVERMRDGLVAIDGRGRIVIVNSEARRMLNWERAGPLVDRPFEQVLRRREDRQVLEVLARGQDVHAELEVQIRDRGPLPIEVKTTVLRDDRGQVRGVIGIFRDQSLQRRLDEMESRVARLAGTEEMALGIAHEIRNPLASIRGAVQELTAGAPAEGTERRLAEIVRRESLRLDRILQEFLDFARMPPIAPRPVDLVRVVEEVAVLLARRPDGAAVDISCRAGEAPDPGPLWVSGDADQLRQGLLNIGINALEALGGRGRLRFTYRRTEMLERREGPERVTASREGAEVLVENDGPPIAPQAEREVFTPFFTTKKGGVGLGLAITHKIVRLHGGHLACEPGELGGPCFRLVLPRLSEQEASFDA